MTVGLVPILQMHGHQLAASPVTQQAPPHLQHLQPTDVQLTPGHDTFLSDTVAEPQDNAPRLRAGMTAEDESRAYLSYDVTAVEHDAERLVSAMLWLYPAETSLTEPVRASFRARLLEAPLTPEATYPPWPAAGDPATEIEWTSDLLSWKRIDVTAHVREALARDEAMGVEISGAADDPALTFEFHSAESSDEDVIPRLILRYASNEPSPTPSPTSGAAATPTPKPAFVPWVEKRS